MVAACGKRPVGLPFALISGAMEQRILHVVGPDQFLPPARQMAASAGSHFWQVPARTWIAGVRTAFRSELAQGYEHVIFHDAWGIEFLASTAAEQHRSVFLHTRYSFLDRAIPQWLRFAGTIFLHNERLVNREAQGLRWIPANRLPVLKYPLFPLRSKSVIQSKSTHLRIGLAGWLVRHRHRLDMWPDLLKHLQSSNVDFSVTVIGEGRGLRWLRRSLKQFPVRFVVCDDPTHFASILQDLDLMLTFSSLEVDSWALLQAAHAGLAVSFPMDNDDRAQQSFVDESRYLNFVPGNAEHAASRILSWWSTVSTGILLDLPDRIPRPDWDPALLRPSPQTPTASVPGWLPLNVYRAMRDYWLTGRFY